ncbi:MAG TPA: glycosyltransferase, partial [Gaiellaceae bacterium]|nr:glycosyltransferase [Gaiellaceae bacterium]
PDKVVYEAAAACLPVLASNPIFDSLLDREARFPRTDPRALADRIQAVAEMSPTTRAAVGHRLRERVEADHSVQSWARSILDAAGLS